MELNKLISTNKLYIIALIMAIGILLFTASIIYRQTKSLQRNSELVSHTLEVQKEINNLFSNYSVMVTAELKQMVARNLSETEVMSLHEKKADSALRRLNKLTKDNLHQQVNLSKLTALQLRLYSYFAETKTGMTAIGLDSLNGQDRIDKITTLANEIRLLKDNMLIEEENLLSERKENYSSSIMFTPLATFASVLFSLLIFVLAFQKINGDRQKMATTQAFLENILKSTNNVIVYYAPIYDDLGNIIDFTIEYSNDVITEATGLTPQEILGRKLSVVYPSLMNNGVFDIMVKCIETNTTQQIEREYDEFQGHRQIFLSTAKKLEDGATLTSVEKTLEVMAERKLIQLNESLTMQNAILTDVKAMANIGSYRCDIKTLKTVFSSNFYRILDCEPNEFKPTFDNYSRFVHPDDLEAYTENTKNIIENKNFKETTYRIRTKRGKLKYLRTKGRFENDLFIGLVRDVTQEFKAEQKLRDKNQDLERSNEELESFNRVASHDLQEPLRKIQMFLSRFSETELDGLSEKGKVYLDKVNSSANRMQTLIKHLLSYSRIKRTKDDFFSTSLGDILEKVQEDLEVLIKKYNVQLVIAPLPVIKVVPFQMEQLFNNLISNAIKYRKTDGICKINIDCEKLTRDQIKEEFRKKAKNYYHITVRDNGIGFEQSNAIKIFELFQRLHQKDEYSGTGIGLAICKKIVESHQGHIIAEGIPNVGATFSIYLPA